MAMETSLRIMGLFVERVGLDGGENQIENKVSLITVSIGRNGDGRIVAEDRHSVGERVKVDVDEAMTDEVDGFIDGGGGDGDVDGLGRCDAVGDCCK